MSLVGACSGILCSLGQGGCKGRSSLAVATVWDTLPGGRTDDVVHSQDHLSCLRGRQKYLSLHHKRLGDAQSLHAANNASVHVCTQRHGVSVSKEGVYNFNGKINNVVARYESNFRGGK